MSPTYVRRSSYSHLNTPTLQRHANLAPNSILFGFARYAAPSLAATRRELCGLQLSIWFDRPRDAQVLDCDVHAYAREVTREPRAGRRRSCPSTFRSNPPSFAGPAPPWRCGLSPRRGRIVVGSEKSECGRHSLLAAAVSGVSKAFARSCPRALSVSMTTHFLSGRPRTQLASPSASRRIFAIGKGRR